MCASFGLSSCGRHGAQIQPIQEGQMFPFIKPFCFDRSHVGHRKFVCCFLRSTAGAIKVSLEVEEEANSSAAKETPQDASAIKVKRRGSRSFQALCQLWEVTVLRTILQDKIHVGTCYLPG